MNRGNTIVWSLALVVVTAVLALIPAVIIAQGNETMVVTPANGGAVESVRTVSNTVALAINEASGVVLIPSMTLTVPDAVANANDLLLIEFGGEARATGVISDGDGLAVEVRVDGVAIIPGPGEILIFASDPTSQCLSHQFAVKVPAGARVVEVFMRLNDGGTNEVLGALMDETMLTVTRAN